MLDEYNAMIKAIEVAGSRAAIAEICKITPQAVSQWHHIPTRRVLAIEKALEGAVTRYEMRPDIYPK